MAGPGWCRRLRAALRAASAGARPRADLTPRAPGTSSRSTWRRAPWRGGRRRPQEGPAEPTAGAPEPEPLATGRTTSTCGPPWVSSLRAAARRRGDSGPAHKRVACARPAAPAPGARPAGAVSPRLPTRGSRAYPTPGGLLPRDAPGLASLLSPDRPNSLYLHLSPTSQSPGPPPQQPSPCLGCPPRLTLLDLEDLSCLVLKSHPSCGHSLRIFQSLFYWDFPPGSPPAPSSHPLLWTVFPHPSPTLLGLEGHPPRPLRSRLPTCGRTL